MVQGTVIELYQHLVRKISKRKEVLTTEVQRKNQFVENQLKHLLYPKHLGHLFQSLLLAKHHKIQTCNITRLGVIQSSG